MRYQCGSTAHAQNAVMAVDASGGLDCFLFDRFAGIKRQQQIFKCVALGVQGITFAIKLSQAVAGIFKGLLEFADLCEPDPQLLIFCCYSHQALAHFQHGLA